MRAFLQMNLIICREFLFEIKVFLSLPHPYDKNQKVFEAYAQNQTPDAYRVFWCYGPEKRQITLVAIAPHA